MNTLIAIAVGGAIGSLARHGVVVSSEQLFGKEQFYGIFFANVVGSLFIGVCYVLLVEKDLLPDVWRPLLMVGFLGAFTTFSTYSLQSIQLLQEGRWLAASSYIIGSVFLSILAAYCAIVATRAVAS